MTNKKTPTLSSHAHLAYLSKYLRLI